ncbi:hypothetical protein PV733_36810 [Streptomyces europaeiscabiei]|uniref:hypothetical protein n=1 Tax=Streptomyces europaeiscabiei TaxID=146819 RepID=UPI0029B0A6C3|nr:hypothetical protein [Streptomyces europaeiscabiei]MDX3714393.1 hypothetical protein [Streptomyces europaeiscabiei]
MTTDPQTDRYRKRPVEIEARQWDGTADGAARIIDWILGSGSTATYVCSNPDRCSENDGDTPHSISIRTLEGDMTASFGDWIIKGVAGEFYPCRNDIFRKTYEPAVPVAAPPTTEQTALRDRIAEAVIPLLLDTLPKVIARARGYEVADAVLAVLAAPADRAALERVRALHQPIEGDGGPYCQTCTQEEVQPQPVGWWVPLPCPTMQVVDEELRRLAAEAQPTPRPEADPLTALTAPALLATIKELRDLRAPLIDALTTVHQSMTSCVGDEWAMEWLGEVWSQLPLTVRAAAGDTDAADELAAEAPHTETPDNGAERIAKVSRWVTSEVVSAKTEFGDGYRAAQRDIRDLINGRFNYDPRPAAPAVVAQPGKETAAALLSTPCDACEHTLNWHRNDVGCMVTRCVCSRFQPPAEDAPAVSSRPGTEQEA